MADMNTSKLASLFEETAEAHHRAFEKTDGADPEWPSWYAEHLHESLNDALGATLTRSELVYLIVTPTKSKLRGHRVLAGRTTTPGSLSSAIPDLAAFSQAAAAGIVSAGRKSASLRRTLLRHGDSHGIL